MDFNQQKRAILEALLPLCPFVAIDGSKTGVEVPEALRHADLVLRIGRDPKVMGMPDLVFDDAGFSATISMQGVRHHVSIPWPACSRAWVAEPYIGPLVVWPDVAQTEAPKAEPPRGPGLRLVKPPPAD